MRSSAAPPRVQQVLRMAVFNVLPTLLEVLMVTAIIWHLFDWRYAAVTFGARSAAISASPWPSPPGGRNTAGEMNDVG